MADWTFTPDEPGRQIIRIEGPVLISEYEDGSENRRQKHAAEKREFVDLYSVDGSTLASMLSFLDGKGWRRDKFTMKTLDVRDAPGTETNVRLKEENFADSRRGPDYFQVRLVWREVA